MWAISGTSVIPQPTIRIDKSFQHRDGRFAAAPRNCETMVERLAIVFRRKDTRNVNSTFCDVLPVGSRCSGRFVFQC